MEEKRINKFAERSIEIIESEEQVEIKIEGNWIEYEDLLDNI